MSCNNIIIRFFCIFSCIFILSLSSVSAWAESTCCYPWGGHGCDSDPCMDCVSNYQINCIIYEWNSECVFIASEMCSEFCPTPCGTVVLLTEFIASAFGSGIILQWKTASEVDNAGFHLWRSDAQDGGYSRITAALIPAEGGPTQGAEYEYGDTDVKPGRTYYYKLEDIDYQGLSTFHGPVSATVESIAVPTLSEWGMIIFALFLATTAIVIMRRRRLGLGVGD